MTAPASPPTGATGDDVEVHVRMYRALEPIDGAAPAYRGLLGDCFLIRVTKGEASAHILIDCGILLGSPNAAPRMRDVAKDIVRACGGDLAGKPGMLDLLIVTHEHWDHIAGFSFAEDLLLDPAKLAIGAIWLAWTENEADPQAQRLRKRFEASGAAFAAMAMRLRAAAADGDDAVHRALFGLDGFLGLAATDAAGKATGKLAGREIMAKLRGPNTFYLEPGMVRATPGRDGTGLRAYVLGPPRDEKRLFKDKPSARAPETYLDAPGVDSAQMRRYAAGIDPDPARDSPFARNYCRLTTAAIETATPDAATRFIQDHYFGGKALKKGQRDAFDRRRIDDDWLGAAGALALKLDSDTNNTSLVIAFELPDADRTILLFAADAQVGNWLSWHDQPYPTPEGEMVTAAQLLARTRLYKVGHHGSHNATLDALGLALMTRDDLFALIPTDEDLGKKQGSKGWKMPDPRLYAALRARTQGRILRNDRTYTAAERAKDPELNTVDPRFFEPLTEAPLYLEYRVM